MGLVVVGQLNLAKRFEGRVWLFIAFLALGINVRLGPAARVRSCGELSPAPGGGQAGRREEPTAAAQDGRTSAALVTAQDKTACQS